MASKGKQSRRKIYVLRSRIRRRHKCHCHHEHEQELLARVLVLALAVCSELPVVRLAAEVGEEVVVVVAAERKISIKLHRSL